jgi:cytochrome c peroxidase
VRLLFAAMVVIPLGLDLYMPVPEENPLTVDKIALGGRLFNDRRLSRDGTTSCASCHNPARAFSTAQALSLGAFGRRGLRNAPALINRGYGRAFFWDARSTSLEEQVLQPIQDPSEMDLTLDQASSRVGLDATTISQALASYVRSILSGDSPYDRFINGDRGALSDEQKAGLQIFRGKATARLATSGQT